MNLQRTQEEFQKLVGSIDETEKGEFLSWIRRSYLVRTCSGQRPAIARTQLQNIISDLLENQNLPVSGVLPSESIKIPERYEDPDVVTFVDEFLREEYEIRELQKQGKLDKYYCKDCKSRNTEPFKILTESASREKINFLFSYLLPQMNGKTVVNVRSRLGGWVYGAYLYTSAAKIVSIEENENLSALQKKIIEKHNMQDRVEVINCKLLDAAGSIQNADVLILADARKIIQTENDQTAFWQMLKSTLKSGTLMVTLTQLDSFQPVKKAIGDLSGWIKLDTDSDTSRLLHSKDPREPDVIYVYKVL